MLSSYDVQTAKLISHRNNFILVTEKGNFKLTKYPHKIFNITVTPEYKKEEILNEPTGLFVDREWAKHYSHLREGGNRLRYILFCCELHTVRDVLAVPRRELMRTPNFGKFSCNLLEEMLSRYGLELKP